jgi:hypothetical protein
MHADDPQRASSITCEGCGTATPANDVVSYGSIDWGYSCAATAATPKSRAPAAWSISTTCASIRW